MGTYLVGSGSKCAVGKQSTWSASTSVNTLINITSESLAMARENGDEGNLLASRAKNQSDLLGITVDGSLSTVLRPEFADWLFDVTLGVSTGTTTKTYTLQQANQDLPVSTVVIERGGIAKTYPDCTVKTVSISAPANDYVTANIDLTGVKELASSESGAQSIPSSLGFTKPSYRCTHASLQYGSTSLDVESTDVKFDNSVTDGPKTYSSGLYRNRPICGVRAIGLDFKIPYSQAVDTFRDTYFKAESAPRLTFTLEFTTNNTAEKVTMVFKNVQLTDGGNSVGGTGLIEANFSGEALDDWVNEPITVTVAHASAVED